MKKRIPKYDTSRERTYSDDWGTYTLNLKEEYCSVRNLDYSWTPWREKVLIIIDHDREDDENFSARVYKGPVCLEKMTNTLNPLFASQVIDKLRKDLGYLE